MQQLAAKWVPLGYYVYTTGIEKVCGNTLSPFSPGQLSKAHPGLLRGHQYLLWAGRQGACESHSAQWAEAACSNVSTACLGEGPVLVSSGCFHKLPQLSDIKQTLFSCSAGHQKSKIKVSTKVAFYWKYPASTESLLQLPAAVHIHYIQGYITSSSVKPAIMD